MKHSLYKQFSTEFGSILSNYPDFVYTFNSNHNVNGIPVFVYHTIEPDLFESQLQFLAENNYKTLTIDEFYDIITGGKTFPDGKSILLTIDDARSSVWRYAYPLLKKYKMSATLFVIPGLTLDDDSERLNLDNLWNNECTLEKLDNIDKHDNTLCNWNEITAMYKSGNVSIESHSLFHGEIFSDLIIMDFISVNTNPVPYSFAGSPYFTIDDIGKAVSLKDYIGLPLFKSSPVMLAGKKLEVSKEFIDLCKDIYSKQGNNGWQNEIRELVEDRENQKKYFDIYSSSRKDVVEDLQTAKRIIQDKLDSNAGNHLCLPWTRGNSTTIEVCKELNIKSCFWGLLKDKKINRPNDDPFLITRLKNDFIFRLPGKGRKSIISIYNAKVKRRFSNKKVF